MYKRLISFIIAVLVIFGCLMTAFAEEKPVYVLLGDSISEGYGVANSSEASFGRIIADTNDYVYVNYGKAARTTDGLRAQVFANEDVRASITDADIISISIGGNDFLCDDRVVLIALGSLLDLDTRIIGEIENRVLENYNAIISEIRTLNPDAVILFQYIYSSWYGPLGNAYQRIVDRINKCIDRCAEENPGEFYIVDVPSVMAGHKELVATDTIHPNADGNVAIAKLIQAKLVDLGLADSAEVVVNAQGINYNYYTQRFGNFLGSIITVLVRFFTGNPI